ncbi:uncharacterized protein LOC129262582 [Lytechinus pictus]|uniref:uncharacterized protein LOC129262582 n=1 Tax=Lytechinus pictus TaxID=7653 RepID=UPI0030B9C569
MDIARSVSWSPETYNMRELMTYCKTPIIAMVKQGHCSLREEDSLSQGQVIRIARIHTQNRVVAKDAKDRLISIPLSFPLDFEVMPKNKSGSIRGTFRKLKRMQLTDLVRNYQLPHKVKLPNDLRHNDIVLNLIGIDLLSGPIDLQQLEEEVYLQGNAVNFGELDTTVLNIPDHSDLEVSLALGPQPGRESQFKKLQNKLADKVAKDVRFGGAVDAQVIKRLIPIGVEDETRSRSGSTLRASRSVPDIRSRANDISANGHAHGVVSGRYQKRDSTYGRPSLSALEKRMKENNPPPLPPPSPLYNNGNSFEFNNAAFDMNDTSDSDELESEDTESDVQPPAWTDIKLDDDDDDDIAPPKSLFGTVSSFSFNNPSTWGFGKQNGKA